MDLLSIDSHRLCAIRRRSRERCIVFDDQVMPPGTVPSHGRVGVEQAGGNVLLLVDRCIPPLDAAPDLRRWLRTGSMRFGSFDELSRWIGETLAPAYGRPGAEPAGSGRQAPAGPCDGGSRRCFLDADALAAEMELQVVGQRPALLVMAEAAARHVARVSPRRPLTIMCIGPTGVGKTSAALSLAEALAVRAGHDWGFVRLDGSELQESHTVARLFGAPPGYIGYGDGTPLADTLRSNPSSVVLVDEIEKAAPSVFRAFIALLDTGRLTGSGEEIRAPHAVFLFTSNIAADAILESIESGGGLHDPGAADRIARRHLRRLGVLPELIGRITHVAAFSHLSAEARAAISELSVHRVAATYGVEVGIIDPDVLASLAPEGTDSAWGARTLEYSTDAALGRALIAAAEHGPGGPIRLSTNPDGGYVWHPARTHDESPDTPDTTGPSPG